MKILSVDYGDAHTGLAACDRTETLASPLGVINERDFAETASKVAAAVLEYGIGEVIVGDPINMNGSRGPRSEKCTRFAELLRGMTDVPVRMWDERQTTITANNYLNDTNTRGKKRRETIDAVAAAVILESYLAYRKNVSENEPPGT